MHGHYPDPAAFIALHIALDIAFGRFQPMKESLQGRNMPALIFQRLSQKLVQGISGLDAKPFEYAAPSARFALRQNTGE